MAVRHDFEKAAQWGVRGFPTLFLQKEDRLQLLTKGYTDAAMVLKQIDLINAQ